MNDERRLRRTLVLGILIAGLGLTCFSGGVALLLWRLLRPDDAVLLPPGLADVVEMTPTPGVLGTPLLPPPLPDRPIEIAILPDSELPSPAPTGIHGLSPTALPSPTRTIARAPTRARPETPTPTRQPPSLPADSPSATLTLSVTSARTFPSVETSSPSPADARGPLPTASKAIPDRILIDAIGLNAPVVPVGEHPLKLGGKVYSQWDVPGYFAAGWQQNSASLGQPGNTVLDGHHNTDGEVFRYLVKLKPGDRVTLEAQGRRFHYIVVQTMTLPERDQPIQVRLNNARWILPTDDERVTLITCWPYTTNTYRLVVIALPLAKVVRPPEIP
jgi:LPXTG-site transpeptidase (sortase) family protein